MASENDPRRPIGVAREGVGCDFCHKIAETGPGGGGRTGVQAVTLRRPPFGRQTLFGPFDDVPRGRDAFAPVFAESRFCAACHQGRSGDVVIYSEFEEWQATRFARDGVSCQSCHMRGDGRATTMSDLGPGRVERDPATLSSHRFHDSRSPELLARAIGFSLTARVDGDAIVAEVEVANRGVGHHLPAGSPMRHMLLIVSAEAGGRALDLLAGPTLPDWAGARLAGRPGRAYAKLLKDRAGTALAPMHPAPFWRPVTLEQDDRIPAGGVDRQTLRFRRDGTQPATVTARLVIRRTFADWADAKTLSGNEMAAAEASLVLP